MGSDLSGWTLVFDLDGTLIDTAPDLHAALNHALAQKGFAPVPLDSVRMMIGDGAKAMIRKGLSYHGAQIDETVIDETLCPAFLDYYVAHITDQSGPFDVCVASLDQFRASGATLSVCTNKAQRLAESVLDGLGLTQYFAAIVGGDALAVKKPNGTHIEETVRRAQGTIDRAIMVGDAWTDEKAARNAGLPFVFVSFGYGPLSAEPYEPLQSISHWREMPQAIAALAQLD